MASLRFGGSAWCNIDIALYNLDQVYGRALEEFGLSVIEAYTLWSLSIQDGQRPSDLAVSIGRVPTSFTPILDKLERKGFVERRANISDRRSVRIFLTVNKEKSSRQVAAVLQATDTAINEYIGSEDLTGFQDALLRLQNIGKKQMPQK